MHGGILATILDETMSWTAIHLTSHFILTRDINISFKKPIFIGSQLTATGEVIEKSGKKALLKAQIRDENDTLCCFGKGEFALFTKPEFGRLKIIPEDFLEEMASSFTFEPAL